MENASKALLIAGSVLIAILLIAMGLRYLNAPMETVESAQKTMDVTAITTFNSQFTPYIGAGKTSGQIKALVEKVIASNAVNDSNKQITLVWKGYEKKSSAELTNILSELDSSRMYIVSANTSNSYNSDGYLIKFYIT